ncbi:MAG: ADOP family duplicated permease [Acidobacteriota bacterium]
MGLWRDLTYRLRALTRGHEHEAELDEELRFHLEMEIEHRMAAGQSRAEATRAARLDFGAPESVKEQVRDAWGVRLVDETRRDLSGAVRQLLASPAFAAAAVGSLAVGLGTATVLFSTVDAVLLRPLPFDRPESLVSLQEVTPEGQLFSISEPNAVDFERLSRHLDAVGIWTVIPPRLALGVDDTRQRLRTEQVSASFFTVLGVTPQLGRTFAPAALGDGEWTRELVLSADGWRRLFDADPTVVGREVDLEGQLWTVIGVMPDDFRFGLRRPDVYLPFVPLKDIERDNRHVLAIARLADGASLNQARQEMASVRAQLVERYPEANTGWGFRMQRLDHYLLGEENRRTHGVLLGVAALLLLLACVNVSNLLLARAADRGDEIQLRLCLGASRGRLCRQLLVESLVVASLGAIGALGLTALAVPAVRGLDIALPRLDEVQLDARTLGVLALAAAISGLVFGVASALRATAAGGGSLRSRSHGADRSGRRLRSTLVMTEVALAMVLAVGAGLLLRSFEQLRQFDAGFSTERTLLARVDLPPQRYPWGDPRVQDFYEQLLPKLEALPGIESVGGSSVSPFRDSGTQNVVALETETDRHAFLAVNWRAVTTDYFESFGVPLLRGRSFDPLTEGLETVISAGLAEQLWPHDEAVGQRLRWRLPDGPLMTVVGVVGEVQDIELGGEMAPTVYWPQHAMRFPGLTLALRSGLEPSALTAAVRDAVEEIDPLLAAPEFSTLDGQRDEALARPLLGLRLVAFSAGIALLLAAAGVYGLIAYAVSQRRREMGIRAAVGAKPTQLVALVLRDAALLLAGGLAAGLAVSLGLVGSLRQILYDTSPFDPQVLATVSAALIAVGLLASALPALRAGRVDPITVLRQD